MNEGRGVVRKRIIDAEAKGRVQAILAQGRHRRDRGAG